MPRLLVVTPFAETPDLLAALRSHNLRVLGEWDLTAEDGRPEPWLPKDPAYAYIDTGTGAVHAFCEGRVQVIGGLLALLGYHALDVAMTPPPPLPGRPDQGPPRVRVDIGINPDLDTRLMARGAIKAAFGHLTDKDIEDLADAKRFTLDRTQILTILVSLLKETRLDRWPIATVRDVFPRLDPLPDERLPSWHPRAGAEARAR